MASYNQPSGFNFVSFLMMIGCGALIYGAIFFAPAYFRKYRAQGVVTETANEAYRGRAMTGEALDTFKRGLETRTVEKLRGAGITDERLVVTVAYEAQTVVVTAQYQEVIKHPFVNKITTLNFHPSYRTALSSGGLGE